MVTYLLPGQSSITAILKCPQRQSPALYPVPDVILSGSVKRMLAIGV